MKWAKNIKISDPLEEGCRLGPLISGGQVDNNTSLEYFRSKKYFSEKLLWNVAEVYVTRASNEINNDQIVNHINISV